MRLAVARQSLADSAGGSCSLRVDDCVGVWPVGASGVSPRLGNEWQPLANTANMKQPPCSKEITIRSTLMPPKVRSAKPGPREVPADAARKERSAGANVLRAGLVGLQHALEDTRRFLSVETFGLWILDANTGVSIRDAGFQ